MSKQLMSFLSALLLLAAGADMSVARAEGYGRHFVPDTSYVWWEPFWLAGDGLFVFETDNLLPCGADTVMYLVRGSTSNFVQVGKSDDYQGSLRSLIEFQKVGYDGWYFLVVRSYGYMYSGTCGIFFTPPGEPRMFYKNVPFGGFDIPVSLVTGDRVSTVPDNKNALDTAVFGFDQNGYPGDLVVMDDDDGPGYAARMYAPEPLQEVVVSNYVMTPPPNHGSAYVVLSDQVDTDMDGLGQALENAMCTCDHEGQVTCSQGTPRTCTKGQNGLYNFRDTDNDGINDYYETIGIRETGLTTYPYPEHPGHLPMWGASPVHKDIFIEADVVAAVPPADPNTPMSKEAAQEFASIYNQSGTASFLKNPDGVDGIAFHLDIGVDPSDPQYRTIYGDWGGGGEEVPVEYPPGEEAFDPLRLGVFHYVAVKAGGAQTGTGWLFRCNGSADHCAHELGHNLNLWHGGSKSSVDQNGKPNYKSLMNYALQDLKKFSVGDMPTLNPMSLNEGNGLLQIDRTELDYLTATDSCWNLTIESAPNDPNPFWGIDWNRDGNPLSSGLVKAAPNYHHGNCSPELGRYYKEDDRGWKDKNGNPVVGTPDATSSPDIKRFNGKLFVAYVESDVVRLLYTADTFTGDPLGGPGLFEGWYAEWEQLWIDQVSPPTGPALGVQKDGNKDYLVVVYSNGSAGGWRYMVFDKNLKLKRSDIVPLAGQPLHEPVMARYNNELMLVYTTAASGQVGPVYVNRMSGIIFGPAIQQSADNGWGAGIASVNALASHPGGMRGVFVEKNTRTTAFLRWYEYQGNNQWAVRSGTGIESVLEIPLTLDYKQRIGLAYYSDSNLAGGGRWYMMYKEYYQPSWPRNRVRVNMTRGYGAGNEVWENDSWYDNIDFYTEAGTAAYSYAPGSQESNIRFATIFSGSTYVLDFRPHATGIINVDLKDTNDFAVFERSLCGSLHGCTSSECILGTGDNACPGGL